MDVSADLAELGRTPVTVVCAGAKSILDIPRTLEYLETQVTSSASSMLRHYLTVSVGIDRRRGWVWQRLGQPKVIETYSGCFRCRAAAVRHEQRAPLPCGSLHSFRVWGPGRWHAQGVCVAAYGADEFPAFFTRRSGCAAPARIDSPQLAAAMIRHNAQLGLGSGAVIGETPFPAPQR